MMVFWILGYLVVGFVVAVLEHKYGPGVVQSDGMVVLTLFIWPVPALVLAEMRWQWLTTPVSLIGLVRWCARRLP